MDVPPGDDARLPPIENKALAWYIIGESASILAEITIRKSPHLSMGYREKS
jgi:hypothetical protein